jgi:chromate transporter
MAESRPAPKSSWELFTTFFLVAMQAFGGALAVTKQTLIDHKRWYTKEEYVEMLTLVQTLPGPNNCKIIIMTGDRYFGLKGALMGLLGFTIVPLTSVCTLSYFMSDFLANEVIVGILKGVLAAVAGLSIGTALSLSETYHKHPLGRPLWMLGAGITFVSIAIFRVPLLAVLLLVGVPWVIMTHRAMKKKGMI